MPVMSSDSVADEDAVAIKHETSSLQLLANASAAAAGQPVGLGVTGADHPSTVCGGCGYRITDRYYLVAVERAWHSECLRCGECRRPLDTALSCFARQSRIYCRDDYYRLFGVRRCNRCCLPLGSNELVMKARDAVFHLACFTCAACNQPLTKGDIFGMRDGLVYCRLHYEMLQQHPPSAAAIGHPGHGGLLVPQHHTAPTGTNGLIGGPDGPCDLSCGPHHGLLPPSGFHPPHHLMAPESVSPSQHMINILSSGMVVDPSEASYLRPGMYGSADYMHSSPDFQRCMNNNSNPSAAFFPSSAGNGSGPSVQKGRPRKRKVPAAAAAAAAAALHSSPGANHSDANLGLQQHQQQQQQQQSAMNGTNLRQLTAGIDLLGNSADLASIEGLVYDSSGTNGSSSGGGGSVGGGGGNGSSQQQQQQQQQRTKRMRTSFKHHQLRTMKSYFAINQNPDAKDLKQLAQKTGLSKRVLQVWFQNARAKWRRNIMRSQDGGVGGGSNGLGGPSSMKDPTSGDLLGASASSQHLDQQHHHHHHHQTAQSHRVSGSLGELTPPGSAGGITHSSAVSNDDANSNLVFSDLY